VATVAVASGALWACGASAPGAGQSSSAPPTSGSPPSADPSVTPATPPVSSPGGPGSTAAVPPLTPLVVNRSGGLTGLMQEISIAADGSWIFTDERTGRVDQGRLSAAQRQQLAKLTSDPGLALEARHEPPPGLCADAFVYVVTVGELSFRYEQCGASSDRPRADALLNIVIDATPM
jgi:hypothetical protein